MPNGNVQRSYFDHTGEKDYLFLFKGSFWLVLGGTFENSEYLSLSVTTLHDSLIKILRENQEQKINQNVIISLIKDQFPQYYFSRLKNKFEQAIISRGESYLGVAIGIWDEEQGPSVIDSKLRRGLADYDISEIISLCFLSLVSIFGQHGDFGATTASIPLKFIEAEARIATDGYEDSTVRGGSRFFMVVSFLKTTLGLDLTKHDEILRTMTQTFKKEKTIDIEKFHTNLMFSV